MTGRLTFTYCDLPVAFAPGDTLAAALERAGIAGFGPDAVGGVFHQFCGIGACQRCLLRVDGVVTEACLTPARDGQVVTRVHAAPEKGGRQ